MGRKSKRIREIAKKVDSSKNYSLSDAIELLKSCPPVKFDQTVDFSIVLGVDTRKADQQVRGTVSLPNGTGKTRKVLVFAKGDKVQEALDAGADFAGDQDLLDKIRDGWTSFDVVISTPDMMREVGKLGKILGPRGLMPTPKAGTVTQDIAAAVKDVKGGKIEFKLDRASVCNLVVGMVSFTKQALVENAEQVLSAIQRAKPPSAKGQYIKSIVLSSTMGPGLKIDLRDVVTT